MDLTYADAEPAIVADTLSLDSWNRPRTNEELRSFVATRHANLPEDIELF